MWLTLCSGQSRLEGKRALNAQAGEIYSVWKAWDMHKSLLIQDHVHKKKSNWTTTFCVTLLRRTCELFPSKFFEMSEINFNSTWQFYPNFCITAQHLVYSVNRNCEVPGEMSVWYVLLVGIDFFLVKYWLFYEDYLVQKVGKIASWCLIGYCVILLHSYLFLLWDKIV